jgi:WD40 repeat protein
MWRCLAILLFLLPAWTRAFDPTQLTLTELQGDPSFMPADTITHVHAMDDGKRILTASRDGSARIWDLATGQELHRFVHPDAADIWFALPILKDTQLLTAGGHKLVTLWDIATGEEIKTFTHSDAVFRLAVNGDASTIAATDRDNLCLLWDRVSGEQRMELKGHSSPVYSVAFLGDDTLLTAAKDKSLRRWDTQTGLELEKFDRSTGCIYTVAPSPDRERYLVFTETSGVGCWSSADNESLWTAALPDDVRNGAWSPRGDRIAAVCDDKQLYILDGKTGAELKKVPLPGSVQYGVTFSLDGKQILCGCEHLLCRFDAVSGERIFPPPGPVNLGVVRSFYELADGKRTIELHPEQGILVRNKADKAILAIWLPETELNSVSISKAANRLVASSGIGQAYVIDMDSGETIMTFTLGDDINASRFFDDGRKVLSAGDNKRLVSWDVASGERLFEFKGHTSSVRWLSMAKNSRRAFSVASDKTLRVWDLMSGTLIATLSGEDDLLTICRVNPIDHRSVIAASKNMLYYWPARQLQVEQALTAEEVDQFVEQLGAPRFVLREAATRRLIEAGESIQEQLNAIQSDDPEIMHRLVRIRTASVKNDAYDPEDRDLLTLDASCSNVSFHPDGVHWVCTEGRGADVNLVFGTIKEDKLVIVHRIQDPNSPHGLFFMDERTLRTTNRNGTFGFYR